MSSIIFLILAIVVAACIARYAESNRLFWALFISLMMGMSGWTLYQKMTSDDNEYCSLVQVDPTQGLAITDISGDNPLTEISFNSRGFVPKPVGQDNKPLESHEKMQYTPSVTKKVLTNPPQIDLVCSNILTQVEGTLRIFQLTILSRLQFL